MFQPNSIKSLLNKRKISRAQSSRQTSSPKPTNGNDTDYQNIQQIKLLTKDIQQKISSIRSWKKQQQELYQQKINNNTILAHSENQIYLRKLEKQAAKYQQKLKNILKQINQSVQIKINKSQQLYDQQSIFNILQQTDNFRKKLKNENIYLQQQSQYSQFTNQINKINSIFTKQKSHTQSPNQQQPKYITNQLLKKQIDQIDNQLKQIQYLLSDHPTNQKPLQINNQY